jgi:hypothetical protein
MYKRSGGCTFLHKAVEQDAAVPSAVSGDSGAAGAATRGAVWTARPPSSACVTLTRSLACTREDRDSNECVQEALHRATSASHASRHPTSPRHSTISSRRGWLMQASYHALQRPLIVRAVRMTTRRPSVPLAKRGQMQHLKAALTMMRMYVFLRSEATGAPEEHYRWHLDCG